MMEAFDNDSQRRADYYLILWADWERRYSVNLGYPSKVPVLVGSGAYWDTDEELAKLDNQAAAAADAVLEDMPRTYRLAIMNFYHARVWRMRRVSDLLASAREEFYNRMKKRGFI